MCNFSEFDGQTGHSDAASLAARQTRSSVTGMSTCSTPSGESVSTTALTTVGGATMAPPSPTPFAPVGLWGDGVTVSSTSSGGIWVVLGSA